MRLDRSAEEKSGHCHQGTDLVDTRIGVASSLLLRIVDSRYQDDFW